MTVQIKVRKGSVRPIHEAKDATPQAQTVESLEALAEAEGIDLGDISRDELLVGIGVEYEHGSRLGEDVNVTKDEDGPALKIAVAHLREIPDYYTRLAAMEAEAKAAVDTGDTPPEDELPVEEPQVEGRRRRVQGLSR